MNKFNQNDKKNDKYSDKENTKNRSNKNNSMKNAVGTQCAYRMEELIPLVADLADRYTSKESSSITYDRAQQLMNAVIYCIDQVDMGAEGRTAKETYERGYQLLVKRVEAVIGYYHQIMNTFDDYGNRCLRDTVDEGMKEFFSWYDVRFNPHNINLTLDYPVLEDLTSEQGINGIEKYLKCIDMEQRFLERFQKGEVAHILAAYNSDYRGMFDNLCEIVYTYMLCRILLGKPVDSTESFSEEDIMVLDRKIGNIEKEKLREQLEKYTCMFVAKYYDGDAELLDYLKEALNNVVVRLKNRCYIQYT